jgi:type IV pilus assembly protein PilO
VFLPRLTDRNGTPFEDEAFVMKLTSMQKMLGVIALVVVAIVAVIALLIVPKFAEMANLEAEARAAQDQLAQAETQLARLQEARANASATQAELLRLANEFPDNPELPSLIIELQDAANASGVIFNAFAPSEPAAVGAQYTEIVLSASVTGTWSDVLDYMRRLGRMTRAIRITNASLAPGAALATASATDERPLMLALQMRAYVMGVNGVAPAVPGAQSGAAAPPAPAAVQ